MILHIISNLMIVVSGSFFIIFVFGRTNKTLESLSMIERLSIKTGLSLIVSGSFLSLLMLEEVPFTEIWLNLGFGLIFTWAAIFHYNYFVKKKKIK